MHGIQRAHLFGVEFGRTVEQLPIIRPQLGKSLRRTFAAPHRTSRQTQLLHQIQQIAFSFRCPFLEDQLVQRRNRNDSCDWMAVLGDFDNLTAYNASQYGISMLT